MRAKARQQCRMIRIALVTTLSALALAACAPQRAVLVPEPVAAPVTPVSPSKQISRAGGELVLPDGTRVTPDQTGGFTLPNGAYVQRDRGGALVLPTGARCTPNPAGYLCP